MTRFCWVKCHSQPEQLCSAVQPSELYQRHAGQITHWRLQKMVVFGVAAETTRDSWAMVCLRTISSFLLWQASGAHKSPVISTHCQQQRAHLNLALCCRGARIVAAAAGACHSMALASDGSLYTWGHGAYGQLGHVALEAVQAVMPQQTIVLPVPKKIACLNPGSLEPANR